MDWLIQFKDQLESLSYLAVLFGIPVGVYSYLKAVKAEKSDREYGTYNALDEKYLEFQLLCFQNPRLDIFDVPDAPPVTDLTPIEVKQELVAFTMLFSIFERSYLMYFDQNSHIKARQWNGWNEYIDEYCERENFRVAWRISGETFDTEFQKFMTTKMTTISQKSMQSSRLESDTCSDTGDTL